MTIAERLTRRVSIELGGKAWPIVFTHSVLLDIEDETGLDVMAGSLDLARPTARAFRASLVIAMRAAGCALPVDDLLRPPRMEKARLAIWDAWREAMPEPEPAGDGDEPQKPLTKLQAWAMARQDLGLTSDEWLAMTPRMAQELQRRRLEQLRQRELMFGMVIANGANFSFCAPKEPLQPKRFMLHPWPEKPVEPGLNIMNAFAEYRAKGLIQRIN